MTLPLFSNKTSQGTASLTLRIGLNSGPTTAGVLRGEKARFQLFGDVSFSLSLCQVFLEIFTNILCGLRR